jgi:hypothetical protein
MTAEEKAAMLPDNGTFASNLHQSEFYRIGVPVKGNPKEWDFLDRDSFVTKYGQPTLQRQNTNLCIYFKVRQGSQKGNWVPKHKLIETYEDSEGKSLWFSAKRGEAWKQFKKDMDEFGMTHSKAMPIAHSTDSTKKVMNKKTGKEEDAKVYKLSGEKARLQAPCGSKMKDTNYGFIDPTSGELVPNDVVTGHLAPNCLHVKSDGTIKGRHLSKSDIILPKEEEGRPVTNKDVEKAWGGGKVFTQSTKGNYESAEYLDRSKAKGLTVATADERVSKFHGDSKTQGLDDVLVEIGSDPTSGKRGQYVSVTELREMCKARGFEEANFAPLAKLRDPKSTSDYNVLVQIPGSNHLWPADYAAEQHPEVFKDICQKNGMATEGWNATYMERERAMSGKPFAYVQVDEGRGRLVPALDVDQKGKEFFDAYKADKRFERGATGFMKNMDALKAADLNIATKLELKEVLDSGKPVEKVVAKADEIDYGLATPPASPKGQKRTLDERGHDGVSAGG